MNEDTLWLQAPAASQCLEIQINSNPSAIEQINMTLFAADHGVTRAEIPAYLQSKTLIEKCFHETPYTHILSNIFKIKIEVINLGTVVNIESLKGVINQQLCTSTENFCHKPAMNREQFSTAINIGRQAAQRAKVCNTEFFICSDINYRNTISAIAITSALLNIPPEQLIEVDDKDKISLITKALNYHQQHLETPLEILRRLGGFELAALTGSYLCCAHMGLPVLIDGLTSSTAALVAARLCPGAEKWFLFATTPEEQVHKVVLKSLNMKYIWDYIPDKNRDDMPTHLLKVTN